MHNRVLEDLATELTLSEEHAHKVGVSSSISLDVARARGYRTINFKGELDILGYQDYQQRVPALAIPLHDVQGGWAYTQIRPDSPRPKINEDGTRITGEFNKYDVPEGASPILDIHPFSMPAIYDPRDAVWIVEGVLKGDSLVSRGQRALSVQGVSSWFKDREAIEAFRALSWRNRTAYIAFDVDIHNNPSVRWAVEALEDFLGCLGAYPFVVDLTRLKGVDDLG